MTTPYQLGLYEKSMPVGLTFEQMLANARDTGFDFLEISIDETDARLARLDWTTAERAEIRRAIAATGCPIRTMCLSGHRKYPLGSHDATTRARGMKIFENAVRLAGDLGVRLIQLAGYDVYYEDNDGETRAYFLENLGACTRLAAAYAVPLGFETMETPFMDTVTKAMDSVHAVDSAYLGVYPDLGNLTNAAKLYGLDVETELRAARGHLFGLHLKETVPSVYRDMDFGTGHVDFAQGVSVARELGVGSFVAEFWDDGRENWKERLKDVNAFIRGFFA